MLTRLAAAMLAGFVLWATASAGVAGAHGNIDQTLEGDPGCNTGNFAASVTGPTGQRQQFVPTGTLLSSVGLCVSAPVDGTPLVIAIYAAGGVLIGGGSSISNASLPDSAGPVVRWVHVDFLQPLTVTPGQPYIIENVSGASITWYGTGAGSPYSYCHGAPNTSAIGDFAFQSYTADAPGFIPCPEPPTPTSTPAPPTNTPHPPTNTPAPGETVGPTNTPAPGETAVAGQASPVQAAPVGAVAPDSTGRAAAGPSSGVPGGLPLTGHGRTNPAGVPQTVIAAGVAMVMLVVGGAIAYRAAKVRA
jgi:hypothetical protein